MIGATPFSASLDLSWQALEYFKGLYSVGTDIWLIAKLLEKGGFVWPPIVDGSMTLTPAEVSVLIEAMTGIER